MLNARGPLMERALESTRELAERARSTPGRLAALQRGGLAHSIQRRSRPAQRRRISIPSSLYGVTTAEDRIADFRLKMNVGVVTARDNGDVLESLERDAPVAGRETRDDREPVAP